MSDVKLTKNEWRAQKQKLEQLQKYLPTLRLKKALLQAEIQEARQERGAMENLFQEKKSAVQIQTGLLSEAHSGLIEASIKIAALDQETENIAGVQVPKFIGVRFEDPAYALLETPAWIEALIALLRDFVSSNIRLKVAKLKQEALEQELKEVSTKVNLFEKILIPRAQANIRKIKVFLGDQLLAAISQSKVAKRNIERHLQKKRVEV